MSHTVRPALAVFRGAQHIVTHANEAFLSAIDFDPVGLPAREAFPDQDAAQDAMDRAYRTGRVVLFRHLDADLLIVPVLCGGQVWGLKTAWAARQAGTPPELLEATRR